MEKVYLENAGQPRTLDIAQSSSAAGQWTLIDKKFYVDDQIEPSIVRDIRVFWPEYVPLRLRRVYRTPAGTTVTREYQVLGRYIENPKEDAPPPIKLETLPAGFKFNPKKIHDIRTYQANWPGPDDEGGPSMEWKVGYPPAPIQIGRWLVEQLAAMNKFFDVGIELDKEGNQVQTGETALQKMAQILDAQEKANEERCTRAMAEARQAMRDDWRLFKKAIDEERWGPDPREPKGFLDLGAKS